MYCISLFFLLESVSPTRPFKKSLGKKKKKKKKKKIHFNLIDFQLNTDFLSDFVLFTNTRSTSCQAVVGEIASRKDVMA